MIDGFELEYTAIIFVQSARVQPQMLFMHLLSWLNANDPERSEKGLPAPTFASETLDDGKCDIKLRIDLRESYSLIPDKQGEWQQHGERYRCVSDFEDLLDSAELNELIYFVGHTEDLPCS